MTQYDDLVYESPCQRLSQINNDESSQCTEKYAEDREQEQEEDEYAQN